MQREKHHLRRSAERAQDHASSQSSDLLDELDHLAFLDRARVVLVELSEALVEVIIIEAGAVGHVRESIADELLSLFLVQVAVAVPVVLPPDLVDALGDDIVNLRVAVMSHLNQL